LQGRSDDRNRGGIEISRRSEDVFSYVIDPVQFPEWQDGVVSAHRDGDAPLGVGSKTVVTRRVGPRTLPTTEEVVELHPPRNWAVRGVDGPVVGIAKGTIEPLDGGQRSRVTTAFDFEAHGIGKLLVPLVVRRQVRKVLPRNEQTLKEILERTRHPSDTPDVSPEIDD
jgi:carbon monoxide dehydrogenase subunit G